MLKDEIERLETFQNYCLKLSLVNYLKYDNLHLFRSYNLSHNQRLVHTYCRNTVRLSSNLCFHVQETDTSLIKMSLVDTV